MGGRQPNLNYFHSVISAELSILFLVKITDNRFLADWSRNYVGLQLKIYFFLLLIFGFRSVMATETLEITLVEDPWPPYIEGAIDSEVAGGVLINLYKEVFSRIDGVRVKYILLPWKRALLDVENGTHDGIMALFKNPERVKIMDFTEPVFEGRTMLWYSTSKFPAGVEWNKVDQLTPYRIVILRASAMGAPLMEAKEKGMPLNIIQVNSHLQQFQMLFHGRAEIAPLTEIVGYHLIKQHNWSGKIAPMSKPLSAGDQYFLAFSKKSPARHLIPQINSVLREMKKSGLVDEILKNNGN